MYAAAFVAGSTVESWKTIGYTSVINLLSFLTIQGLSGVNEVAFPSEHETSLFGRFAPLTSI